MEWVGYQLFSSPITDRELAYVFGGGEARSGFSQMASGVIHTNGGIA